MPRSRYQSSPIGRSAGLGALAARVDGRVLEHQQQVGELAGGAAVAQRSLQLERLRVGDRSELRDPELRHVPKATLRPVSHHEERFWPTRMRWRLRGAWMWPSFVAITLLDGVLLHTLLAGARGHRPDPRHPARHLRQPRAGRRGRRRGWRAALWKRRPAADPAAPPKAQLEVLSDRIGTGLLVASVFGILAAGLAARPDDRRRDRPARAGRASCWRTTSRPTATTSCAATSRRPTRARSPTATTAAASRTTTASAATCFFLDAQAQETHARSATRASSRTSASPRAARQPPVGPHLEQLDVVAARAAAPTRARISEKYSVAPAAQVEAAPDRPDAAVDGHREVAHRAGRAALAAGRSRAWAGSAPRARRARAARRWRARRARALDAATRRPTRPGRSARGAARSGTRTPTGRRTSAALCGAACRTCARATARSPWRRRSNSRAADTRPRG